MKSFVIHRVCQRTAGLLLMLALFALPGLLQAQGAGAGTEESAAAAAALSAISNFRQYSENFASAGQPDRQQLQILKDNDFERIIYIAFTNSRNAIADEDQVVKGLGMEYIQVPVDWERPRPADFYAVADVMRRDPARKTLLHCQVNARATAFALLYRVLYEDVPLAEAKQDMNSVWEPNETWRDFIFQVLRENGVTPECSGCDWSVAQ